MLMLRFKFESFFKRLSKYSRKVNRLEAWRRFLKHEHQQEEQLKRIKIEAVQRRWSEQYYTVEKKSTVLLLSDERISDLMTLLYIVKECKGGSNDLLRTLLYR